MTYVGDTRVPQQPEGEFGVTVNWMGGRLK